jgi:hypothetical protein
VFTRTGAAPAEAEIVYAALATALFVWPDCVAIAYSVEVALTVTADE